LVNYLFIINFIYSR